MIYITQIIYIKEGQEDAFDHFEDIAISILPKHNGELLMRQRPLKKEMITCNIKFPYEIHLIRFDSNLDFQNFMKDEERINHLFIKEEAIESLLIIKGKLL